MKRVLILGFEPFGGEARNPSGEIADALDGARIAGAEVVGRVLPVVFGESRERMLDHLREVKPVAVLAFGLAGGRTDVTPERVAINVDDARIPDNAGNQPIDVKIIPRAPTAYWSSLPIKAIVAALQKKGIPASVSQTAGTFVCNHVFFSLMHAVRTKPGMRGGFIHVPNLPASPGAKSGLPLEQAIEAARIAIETTLVAKADLKRAGGATH